MILYWSFVSVVFFIILIIILIKCDLMFKHSKLSIVIKSKTFNLLIKRLVFYLITLFLVITCVFLLLKLMPKEYFYAYHNKTDPLYGEGNLVQQLLRYYHNILPFPKKVCASTYLENNVMVCSNYKYKIIDLGRSYTYMKNVEVSSIIKERCLISFKLGIIAYIIQCLIGYPLGIFLARKENKIINSTYNAIYLTISTLPRITYFYIFVILFLVVFKLPVNFEVDNYITYIAPLTAITLTSSIAIAFWVKKYILLEANKDYVKFAISKGLDEKTIFYKHIIKNALIPLIRTIPTSLAACLIGFYLLESAFGIPGSGLTLINALNLQDIYLIQGLILFFSTLSITSYLIGDLITVLLDHRVSLYKEGDKHE